MELIQKSASTEFYLPEYPHVPEEALSKFYNELTLSGKIPEGNRFIL